MELTPKEYQNSIKLNIGVISDTHGLLRNEAVSALSGSDLILHAGDVGKEGILHRLESIAPVFTVRGNVDFEYWCRRLPNKLTLNIGEFKLHMLHDISHLDPRNLRNVSMVIFGHSHRPEIAERDQVIYLNPGSSGPKRFDLPVTLAKLNWAHGQEKLTPELIQLL